MVLENLYIQLALNFGRLSVGHMDERSLCIVAQESPRRHGLENLYIQLDINFGRLSLVFKRRHLYLNRPARD
jgi:hypothetical protein